MARALAVIGANFGDEGKGLVTDFLCAKYGAGVVVRFNGGAQAGHTVVTPEGRRHVFHHFGSGTMLGVPTFLSQYFSCNPILFFKELDELTALGITPSVFAHPDCLVTTFADMIINQTKENARGAARHGSVGVGVHETVVRSRLPHLRITMSDLWNRIGSIEAKLVEICGKYSSFRTGSPIINPGPMIEAWIKGAWKFADVVSPAGIGQCKDPIFEGAQGLLLDQSNAEYFPHVTHSNTGIKNVRALWDGEIEAYYVSRTYLTRHGAGKLPGEDPKLSYPDSTNVEHDYQGRLRFAPLDDGLARRCRADFGGENFKLVLTHCDQEPASLRSDLTSRGPTRRDVK